TKVEKEDSDNDVIVTEDDVDEELIEIVLSEEQESKKETSESKMEEVKPTAEDIIGDPAVADKWLQRVEADPKQFLKAKFSIQYRQGQEADK
ncbi:MAG: hypothetical protein ACPHV3_04850, partial [Vibrio sp.]